MNPVQLRQVVEAQNALADAILRRDLEAVNAGRRPPRGEFWPPRRNPLPETGLVFAIRGAELDYLEARPMVAALRDWVDSLQTAERLIWPGRESCVETWQPSPMTASMPALMARLVS